MIRGDNNLVRALRDLLIDIDELKTAQQVGTDQIITKRYDSGLPWDKLVTITAPFQSAGSSFKLMRLTVIPENLTENNILLSEVIPHLTYTSGPRVTNWGTGGAVGYGLSKINSNDPTRNTYLLFIVAPTNYQMRVKMYIVANAKVTFTLEDLI